MHKIPGISTFTTNSQSTMIAFVLIMRNSSTVALWPPFIMKSINSLVILKTKGSISFILYHGTELALYYLLNYCIGSKQLTCTCVLGDDVQYLFMCCKCMAAFPGSQCVSVSVCVCVNVFNEI